MKTEKQFIKWIEKYIDYYKPILGLSFQRIKVYLGEDEEYLLKIQCSYPYNDPDIKYSKFCFKLWTEGKIYPDIVLHELLHIITDPLYCKAVSRYTTKDEIGDERERLTDNLTLIIRNIIK